MSTTPAKQQNYVLYRTTQVGWQKVGYVIMTMMLSSADDYPCAPGAAVALDTAAAYPAGSIYPAPSTTYTLTGPATAIAGTPMTLDVTPNNYGPAAATVVTLSDGGAGGTFSASTVMLGADATTVQTVTYTPKVAGTVTISATNSGGLTDPAGLNITVAAATA